MWEDVGAARGKGGQYWAPKIWQFLRCNGRCSSCPGRTLAVKNPVRETCPDADVLPSLDWAHRDNQVQAVTLPK